MASRAQWFKRECVHKCTVSIVTVFKGKVKVKHSVSALFGPPTTIQLRPVISGALPAF